MRKFAAITAVMVLLLTARASSAGPPMDFVAGGGQHLAFGTGPDVVNFGITAHSGPAGENPTGAMTSQIAGEGSPAFHAEVTCLMVAANRAIATGIFTQPESARGQIVVGDFVDNSTSGTADLIRFSFDGFITEVTPPSGVEGPCFVPILPPVEVIRGKIVINDAQP
jgi:hypothetical protein